MRALLVAALVLAALAPTAGANDEGCPTTESIVLVYAREQGVYVARIDGALAVFQETNGHPELQQGELASCPPDTRVL